MLQKMNIFFKIKRITALNQNIISYLQRFKILQKSSL